MIAGRILWQGGPRVEDPWPISYYYYTLSSSVSVILMIFWFFSHISYCKRPTREHKMYIFTPQYVLLKKKKTNNAKSILYRTQFFYSYMYIVSVCSYRRRRQQSCDCRPFLTKAFWQTLQYSCNADENNEKNRKF